MDKLLTIATVSSHLNVSRRTIYRLCAEGQLKACKVRGSLRIFESSIGQYLDRQTALYALEIGICDSPATD